MKCRFLLIALILLCTASSAFSQSLRTISGYVKELDTGEELIGVTIYAKGTTQGTVTNVYGFYSLSLPPGNYTIVFSFVGYESYVLVSDLTEKNVSANIDMQPATIGLQEVVITGEHPEENITKIQMSSIKLDVAQVKKLPSLFGEADIIKVVQMQPGVISAGEGTSAFFVRGGNADQNLMLIDEAPVYDASHLFGMFSVFNADVIKSSELHKGGIPARYGGRLASVLDVRTRDGNTKNFSMMGGIGTMASRLTLEAPIIKDKSSFLLSGRRSYLDVFQKMSSDLDVNSNLVYFYDINAKLSYKPTNKDRFFLAGYFGRDEFSFNNEFWFDWGNATVTGRWNHLFSERLFSNTTFVLSRFSYDLEYDDIAQGFHWEAEMLEVSGKIDLSYYLNPNNLLTFGYSISKKSIYPATIRPTNEGSIFTTTSLESMYAFEHGFYLANEQTISPKFSMEYGLRMNYFSNVGESIIREYEDPHDNVNIRYREKYFGKNEEIISFFNPEPRFAARYRLNPSSSIKASYNRMVQNIHLMSNSTVPVPFNTWQPSSPYLKPQKADQVAAGYFKNWRNNTFEFSVEAYHKWMKNITEFADNVVLFFNPDIAVEFRPGDATSYGAEFFLNKKKGKLQGALSYTWSKTTFDIPGINHDEPYPANYDRRHAFNAMAIYELNDKWTFGANWLFNSGRPITLPTGKYDYDGYNVDYVTERNGYKLPDFHRLDLSATLTPRKSHNKRWKGSWIFAVYNSYNRKNPYTIYTKVPEDDDGNVSDPNAKEARLVYLFPILPSVTYNFKF